MAQSAAVDSAGISSSNASNVETTYLEQYNYDIVKKFALMAIFWGIAGMSAGTYIASELAWPFLNFDIAQITFGRLRPLHTSGVIFGFGGNALFATSYYIVQRTCQTPLWGGKLADFTFWGWNIAITIAGIGYLMGITQGREYAEPEWYVDIMITVVWVVYFVIYTMTLLKRNQPHIYVANWFFMSFILAVALLHIFNNLAVPVSFLWY